MDVIRWTAYIYIMVFLMITTHLQAQEKPVPLQKQMQITQTSLSIHSLSGLITAQTGLYLSFNANKIAAGKKITLQKRVYIVEELLEVIKANTGIGYKVYQEHIIFHRSGKTGKGGSAGGFNNEGGKQTAKTTSLSVNKKEPTIKGADFTSNKKESSTKIKDPSANKKAPTKKIAEHTSDNKKPTTKTTDLSANKKAPITKVADLSALKKDSSIKATDLTANKNTKVKDLPTNKEESPIKISDLVINKKEPTGKAFNNNEAPKYLNIEILKAPQTQTSTRTALLYKPTFTGQHQSSPKQYVKASWFVDGGLIIDEIPYFQPTIMGGHPFLHAIISWGTNFHVTGFRYGLGATIPLKNDWRLGIQVTTGKMQRDYDFRGERDTLKNITVKSDLHRLALQLEKPLNRRLVIKAGPVFNLLKSTYFQKGNPVTIATSGYAGTNGDREFYAVRPLYTLSNSFKTTEPSNIKAWIGFQVSLFYRINF